MKSRIIYPNVWCNDNFIKLSSDAKLLFLYLISNNFLGLCQIYYLSDRQIMFDTGLSKIDELKGEIEISELIYFYKGWLYHNHELAYVDYFGNEKVENAKQKEISKISRNVKDYFKGLVTGREGLNKGLVIEHKPETINHKLKIINHKEENKQKKNEIDLEDVPF